MAGIGNIDPNVDVNNNPAGGGSVTILADDIYCLEIIESDVKPNSGGTGKNADFKIQVAEGEHKGVWFFGGITSIEHNSAQAQNIAQGQLKALCLSAGVDFSTLTDTEQLHFRPFYARVGSETYFSKKHQKDVTKNVIVKYMYDGMPEEEAAAPPATPKCEATTPPPKQPEAAPVVGRRPWQK